MKSILHILFALALLVSSTGIPVSSHYCGGKLHSRTVGNGTPSCCEMMEMDASKCCHNETELHQVVEEVTPVTAFSFHPLEIPVAVIPVTWKDLPQDQEKIQWAESLDQPPPGALPDFQNLFQTYLL